MSDLGDLNKILFDSLDRLTQCDSNLSEEIKRANAISGIAGQIISNATLALKAREMKQVGTNIPEMIEEKKLIPNYKTGQMYAKVSQIHRG